MRKRSEVGPGVARSAEDVREVPRVKPSPLEFPTAQPVATHDLDPGFARIVETLVIEDPWEQYRKLERLLRAGPKRTDRGTMLRRLDEAESCARLAHRLYMNAMLERRRWELDNQVISSACREKAKATLQRDKESGEHSKQITDEDVLTRAALLFPDEYRATENKYARVKRMVDSMEHLSRMWESRCRTLATFVTKMR